MLSVNEKTVVEEQAFVGVPSSLDNVCKVYPLKMIDILTMGTNNYNGLLGLLLLTEVDIAEMIKNKTEKEIPIEDIQVLPYLLMSADNNNTFLLDLKLAFSTFIKEEILFLPKINSVLIGSPKEKRLITQENFGKFQDILRIQNKKPIKEPPPKNESAIARKFRLKREQRDAIKRKQQQKNGEGQSLIDLMEIASTFGIDYKNETLFAFYNLIRRHQAKEKWEQDIQMLCAGADSNKLKTKYWGENLNEK